MANRLILGQDQKGICRGLSFPELKNFFISVTALFGSASIPLNDHPVGQAQVPSEDIG
jgi:hypothetical protein